MKVTEDRNEAFATWRERDYHDRVLAPALFVGGLGGGYSVVMEGGLL